LPSIAPTIQAPQRNASVSIADGVPSEADTLARGLEIDELRAERSARRFGDVGGTSGGLGTFLAGFVMAVAGGYLLMDRVTVTSHFWQLFGYDAFGLSLLPLIVGVGMLFFDGRNVLGWLLVVGGMAVIAVGILVNLTIFFRPTSLFNTLMMLVLLAGGLGLVARSLRPR
jgi:hypothetical protein